METNSVATPPVAEVLVSKKPHGWLRFLLGFWVFLTVLYIISFLGLLITIPFGLLALVVFFNLGLPMPFTLWYFPVTLTRMEYYPSLTRGITVLLFLTMLVNAFGVYFSIKALRKLKVAWQWAYVFVVLGYIQLFLAFSNIYLGTCNLNYTFNPSTELDSCAYGFHPQAVVNLITSVLIFISAYAILFLSRRQASNSKI
jgi:hypothetical protein